VDGGKICFLTETFHPTVGGTQTQTRLLAEDLTRMGFKITVVTRRSFEELPPFEDMNGIRIHRIPPSGPGKRKRWKLMLNAVPRLISLRKEYDVIYVAGFRALGVAALIAGRLCGKRCALRAVSSGELSGTFFDTGLQGSGLRASSFPVRVFLNIRNAILRRADSFIAVSSLIRQEFTECRVRQDRISLIPNGVDTDIFKPVSPAERTTLRRKLDIPENATVFIYTGRLVSYKGLPELIRAWKDASPSLPGAMLLLVGSDENDKCNCEQELRAAVAAANLGGSVRFTGRVPDVYKYLQSSDALVFPTRNEAFGISAIEAMACGLPIISTLTGGLRDIVEPDVNGLVIEPGDETGIRNAILKMAGDRALRESLGKAALETVQTRYSRTIMARAYADLLGRLSGTAN